MTFVSFAHVAAACPRPGRLTLLGLLALLPWAATCPPARAALLSVDPVTLVRLTYENNLRVTAARYDVEAAEYQFQRFERNLSQFRPFVLETGVERQVESALADLGRRSEREDEGHVTIGMTKEFFDGSRFGASSGMRQTRDTDGRNRNPFVALEARFPLFSSFTRLERITERSFEESEMLGAWLDFIDTVRDAIADSQEAYFDLQHLLALRTLSASAQADFDALLHEPGVAGRPRDVNLLRDQIQAYQSRIVEEDGAIAAAHIGLIDRLGLDGVPLSSIATMDFHSPLFYGSDYLDASPDDLTGRAIDSDVEVRVLQIARENARLKRALAERGKWDIVGRILGAYDFDSRGDDPTARRGYRAEVAFSVERNDPRLLHLSLKRADAEERKFEARIAYRRRQLENEITRRLGQATSLQGVVRELETSRDLRRAVFAEKRATYLAGEETLENVILARGQLFGTERDLLASLGDFFEIVIDLDLATGAYFTQLEGITERFELFHADWEPGAREARAAVPAP